MTSAHLDLPPLVPGLAALAPRYDVILCDVWGVVHDGRRHFAAACDALSRFRAQGGTVVLITNAPRPNQPIRTQLDGLGVPRAAYDDIVTSGDVTLAFIAARGNAPLHHIGPPRDLTLFEILRDGTGLAPPLVPLGEATYVVCTGLFDDRSETPEDYDPALALMRARSMDLVSANPDLVVHVGDRLIYCSGAIAERYETLGGKVLQAGKPFRPIYEKAVALAAARRGGTVDPARVLAVGDAIRTDIRGARDFGLDALFVTSGIHREELHPRSELDHAAFRQFLAGEVAHPTAAMAALAW
jgi:HAD superfamily hydrolase (TIGR01459 family)